MKPGANKLLIMLAIIFLVGFKSSAQNILSKNISSFEVNRQCLTDVLEILRNKGNFYFSYNSAIIKKDSIVTLTAYNKTVRQILDFYLSTITNTGRVAITLYFAGRPCS